MLRKTMIVLAMALAFGSAMSVTTAFARGGRAHIHIGGRVGHFHQIHPLRNRIPAPLPSPAEAPVINGPLNPTGLPSMGNGIR